MIEFITETDFNYVNTGFLLVSLVLGIGMITSPKLKGRPKVSKTVAACFILIVLRLTLYYSALGWHNGRDIADFLNNSFLRLLLDGGVCFRLLYVLLLVRTRQERAITKLARLKFPKIKGTNL